KDIDNRSFTASKDVKLAVNVTRWRDDGKAIPGRVTTTGNVILHKNAIRSPLLGNQRSLVVYLPPEYEKNKDQRYPVLYMQDGQNLFDESTSFQGIEWRLDETAQQLISQKKMEPLIIVGVYNAETRTAEFTPPLGSASSSAA